MPIAAQRRLRVALLLFAAIVAGAILYVGYLGYWGGSITRLVPATAPAPPAERGTAAVFFSGDMGFNTGMGPRIADDLASRGMPVLGVNSLTAFARRRSVGEARALVRDAAARALRDTGAARLVLVGQSFGANALLTGIDGLPPPLRRRVRAVVLVVPARTRLLRATPGGAFDLGDDGPAASEARRLDWAPVLCLHGAEEEGSLCPTWRQPNVASRTLPGDHYLRHDDRAVARAALDWLSRRRGDYPEFMRR